MTNPYTISPHVTSFCKHNVVNLWSVIVHTRSCRLFRSCTRYNHSTLFHPIDVVLGLVACTARLRERKRVLTYLRPPTQMPTHFYVMVFGSSHLLPNSGVTLPMFGEMSYLLICQSTFLYYVKCLYASANIREHSSSASPVTYSCSFRASISFRLTQFHRYHAVNFLFIYPSSFSTRHFANLPSFYL
jgi:hypothetical protein